MKKNKRNLERRPLWMYLLYVILICGIFGATTYSRYTSQVTGTGTAVTARFAVDSNVKESLTVAVPAEINTTAYTPIEITNSDTVGNVSEVELEYRIQIVYAGEVPCEFALEDVTAEEMRGKGTRVTLKEGAGEGTSLTIESETGTMPAAKQTVHSYRLAVSWPSGANDASLAGSINGAALKVEIVQAEPGAAK